MKNPTLILFLFSLFLQTTTNAQQAVPMEIPRSISPSVSLHSKKDPALEKMASFRIPLFLDEQDEKLIAGTFLAISALIISPEIEDRLLHEIQNTQNPQNDQIMKLGKNFGEGLGLKLAVGSLVYVVVANKETGVEKTFLAPAAAIIAAGLANNVLKIIFHRALPKNAPHDPWARAESNNPAQMAFPSGHTTAAIVTATIIGETLKGHAPEWVTPFVYGIAALTAASRVYHNEHWVSDVLASLYSYYLTKFIYKTVGSTSKQTSSGQLRIEPALLQSQPGFQIRYEHERNTTKPCAPHLSGLSRVSQCVIEATQKK